MKSPYNPPFQTLQKKFGTDPENIKHLDKFDPTDMRQVAYFASVEKSTYSEKKFAAHLVIINHKDNRHFRKLLKEIGTVVKENAILSEYVAFLFNGLSPLSNLSPFFCGHSSIDVHQDKLDVLPQVLKEFLIDEHRKKQSNPVSFIDIESDSFEEEASLSAGESDYDDTEENHNKSALETFLAFAYKYRFYGACAAGSLALATAVSLALSATVGFPILVTFSLAMLASFAISAFALSRTQYGDLSYVGS